MVLIIVLIYNRSKTPTITILAERNNRGTCIKCKKLVFNTCQIQFKKTLKNSKTCIEKNTTFGFRPPQKK